MAARCGRGTGQLLAREADFVPEKCHSSWDLRTDVELPKEQKVFQAEKTACDSLDGGEGEGDFFKERRNFKMPGRRLWREVLAGRMAIRGTQTEPAPSLNPHVALCVSEHCYRVRPLTQCVVGPACDFLCKRAREERVKLSEF